MKAPPNGSKTKKPYYLRDCLQFVMPYIKPINITENPPQSKKETDSVTTCSTEETQNIDDWDVKNESTVDIVAAERLTQTRLPPQTIYRRSRRPLSEADKSSADYLKIKSKRYRREETTNQRYRNKSIRYFMLSLLPEFETMTEDQIRTFKIKVMILINEMKSNPSRQSPIASYSNAYCEPYLESSLSSHSSPNQSSTDNCTTETAPP